MKFSFATEDNEAEIKQLLIECDLLHEDITADQLKNFLLGRDESKLAAVVGLEIKGQNALLRSLAVAADYRNRKIATRLVSKIEDHARGLRVHSLYLLTLTAEAFFKNCGYRRAARDDAPAEIQQTAEFRNLCPASAACMFKNLEKPDAGGPK